MKKSRKRIYIFYGFVLTLFVLFFFNHFFSQKMIVGKYVNRNFEDRFIAENPHVEDTLMIFSNNRFFSKFYGKGNYELSYDIDGTYIELNYKDEAGQSRLKTSIRRKFLLGTFKIDLCYDLNQYYEKIN